MLIALFFVVGIGVALLGVVRVMKWRRIAKDYRTWPSVQGTVLSSALRTAERYDDDNSPYDVWLPVASYRYAIAGAEHEGKRAYWFDEEFRNRDAADRWLAAHPVGAVRAVFYDPAHPAKSALVLNFPANSPGSGLIWLGLALAIGAVLGPAFA